MVLKKTYSFEIKNKQVNIFQIVEYALNNEKSLFFLIEFKLITNNIYKKLRKLNLFIFKYFLV